MTDKSSNAISVALVAAAGKEIVFVKTALTRIILPVDISILHDRATIAAFDKDGC